MKFALFDSDLKKKIDLIPKYSIQILQHINFDFFRCIWIKLIFHNIFYFLFCKINISLTTCFHGSLDFRPFLENVKMSSSLSKIPETEMKDFIINFRSNHNKSNILYSKPFFNIPPYIFANTPLTYTKHVLNIQQTYVNLTYTKQLLNIHQTYP